MKKIILLFSAAAMLAACNKEEVPSIPEKGGNEMHFVASYPGTKATSSAFEAGDVMGVYVTKYDGETPVPLQISGNYANNAASTFDGAAWDTQPPVYWQEGRFDVYAYYPYMELSSVDECRFSVALDQSTEEISGSLSGYEASDFLWAKNEGIQQSETVPLVFKHRMSKLVVNLIKGEEFSGEIPPDAEVRVHNTVADAYIDIATGTVTRNQYEQAKTITARKVSDGVYTAIIVPQRIDTRRPFVEILSRDVSYLIESSFVFKSGVQHTINITLNNDPEKVGIEIGGDIEGGWE